MSIEPIASNRGIQALRQIHSFYDGKNTPQEIAVLVLLTCFTTKEPVCHPSVRQLADMLGRSPGTINQILLGLEERAKITISTDGNKNIYAIVEPLIRYGRLATLLDLEEQDYDDIERATKITDRSFVDTECAAYNAYYMAQPGRFKYSREPLAGFILWLTRSMSRLANSGHSRGQTKAADTRLSRLQEAAFLLDEKRSRKTST